MHLKSVFLSVELIKIYVAFPTLSPLVNSNDSVSFESFLFRVRIALSLIGTVVFEA